MSDLLERPPDLPPILRPKRRRRGGILIMPDICRCHIQTRTLHDNVWTIHYFWMCRWHLDTGHVELAHVNSRRYKNWLQEWTSETGVVPHVQFGGARVAHPEAPRDIYTPWIEYAKREFC